MSKCYKLAAKMTGCHKIAPGATHIVEVEVTPEMTAEAFGNPGVPALASPRLLALLEEAGVLAHAHLEGGAEYHRVEEAGHVHLSCSRCGAEDDLSLEEAAALSELIERHRGFLPDLTHFAISGLCAECRQAVQAAS